MSKAAANYLAPWLLALAAPVFAAPPDALETRDFLIPSLDAGIELHLRNRHPAGLKDFPAGRVVLFVHGATFPASSTFDVDLPGGSWMQYVAERGYDVYSLDIRGYGGSTRPAAMSQPPEANPPFAGTREAVRDIAAAVDHILAERKVSQLTLVGWSWGTTTTAAFAAEQPSKVGRLVLFAPVWLGVQSPQFKGAYRTSTRESVRAFSIAGMPGAKVDEIAPLANYNAWWAATQATDPEGARQTPPVVRSPNGVLQDFAAIWAAGKTTYEPEKIRAPTLLVVGEWDAITPPAMAFGLYVRLSGARERRLVLMSEGTHFMAIEKHRGRLMREVQNFLDEID
jgi:pimeloyl-ACP methyl ester carboxylesterase